MIRQFVLILILAAITGCSVFIAAGGLAPAPAPMWVQTITVIRSDPGLTITVDPTPVLPQT